MTAEDLQRLIADRPDRYELIETHANWILLDAEHAFKIKKPVRYSFLDYSTLDLRRHYCQLELTLNRRFSEGIYLDVAPVVELDGRIGFGPSEGTVLDYAVKMKRLPADRQMHRMLEAGQVTEDHIRAIARRLAAFHRQASAVYRPVNWEEMAKDFSDLTGHSGLLEQLFGRKAAEQVWGAAQRADTFLYRHRQLLQERNDAGFTVDGHGDLHSANIFLLDEPVFFDCIEFDEHLRQVDVLDELAFLSMDLDRFGRSDLADLLVNAYQKHHFCLPGEADKRLFYYYRAYRANVRLKVKALSIQQHPPGQEELEEMKKYLQLMVGYQAKML